MCTMLDTDSCIALIKRKSGTRISGLAVEDWLAQVEVRELMGKWNRAFVSDSI